MKNLVHKQNTHMVKMIVITCLIIVGVSVGVYLVNQPQLLSSFAEQSVVPQNVKISNLSDNSFTVSWTTPSSTTGFITYGDKVDQLNQAQEDDRDTSGSRQERYTHHVTIKSLNPQTTYYFKIGSGAQIYDNNGSVYQQATPVTPDDTPSTPDLLFGTVSYSDNSTPPDTLVYVNIPGGTLLSTYTKDGGKWLVTLDNARMSSDQSKYVPISSQDTLSVSADTGALGSVSQTVSAQSRSKPVSLVLSSPPKQSEIDLVKADLGKSGSNLPGDLNHDNVVNMIDFSIAIKDSITH